MTSSCCKAYTPYPEWGRCPRCFEHATFKLDKTEKALKLLIDKTKNHANNTKQN